MTVQPKPGEQLVGAYHQFVTGCDVVSYNQRSQVSGEQMELDVLALHREHHLTVYACEVVTHLGGMSYSGTPNSDRWAEYGNINYQNTLEKIEDKFRADYDYVTNVFDGSKYTNLHECKFQLWSPSIPDGYLTEGLDELKRNLESDFKSDRDWRTTLDLIYNEEYADRIEELQSVAADDHGSYGNSAFRVVQILENVQ